MTNREKTIIESALQMDIIREMDITKRHFMNENWEPTNHQLSTEEFKRCWICLAGVYVKLFYSKYLKNILKDLELEDDDKLFVGWLFFLHNVRKAVVQGPECNCIKKLTAGISRDVLINFLDF